MCLLLMKKARIKEARRIKNFLSLKRKASWKLFTEHFFMLVKAD